MNRRELLLGGGGAGRKRGERRTGAGGDRARLRSGSVAAGRQPRRVRGLDEGQPRRGRRLPRPALGPLSAARSRHNDVWDRADKRAFLMTPREEFVTADNLVARLRVALSRYRLRRHHHRAAYRGADDQHAGRQAGRQGARDRHRLRLPIGLSELSHRQTVVDRDHAAAGQAHARRLRLADRARLQANMRRSRPGTPTAIMAGRRPRRSTRSSSPAASTTFRRRCCSS